MKIKLKILVVDDKEENIYLLETLLKGSGYEVASAGNGAEALEKLKKDSIDIIISDILMPGMDGFQLCRECKKDEKLKRIPFIFYTATYTEKKDEEFALNLGAERFIRKPLDPVAFMEILEEIIAEYKKRTLTAPKKPIPDDEIYLAEYNKRLVKKLEKKILDLNEANKKLKESEKKYSTLVEKGNDGIIIIQDNLLKFINSKMSEITGFSIEEALEKPFIEFVSPEYRELVIERYKKRLSGEKVPNKYEIEILSKDSKKIPVEINASVIEYKGNPADMAIIRDITARKQSEKEIQRRTEDLALINSLNHAVNRGDALEDVIKLLAENTKEIFSCHGATVYLPGEDGEHLVIQNLPLPPETVNKIENLIGMKIPAISISLKEDSFYTEVLRSGRSHLINDPETIHRIIMEFAEAVHLPEPMRWTIKDVIPRVYKVLGIQSVIIIPLISNSKVIGLVDISRTRQFTKLDLKRFETIARQLTAVINRRRAEEALRESEEKFRNLAEQSPNIIFINKGGKVVYANKKCEEMTGYKRENFYMENFNFISLTLPEHAELIRKNIKRNFEGEDVSPFEFTIISKKGSMIDVILTSKLIKYEGEVAMLGIITDITDRKRAEDELKRTADELARSNDEMETFVYSVAHDLRTPLRAIKGFSDALIEDYSEQMDATAKDYARRISTASKRMDTMIHNLLAYISISREEMKFENVDLDSLIDDTLEQIDSLIIKRNAKVVVEKKLSPVLANRDVLSNIIGNLISNAVKFVSPDVMPFVKVGAKRRGEYVRIWVEDNGIGIEPEYHKRIFRVFERLHGVEEYPGTGIGLAIVSKGVERMRGRVGVESKPGKGSRFWVELPGAK